MSFARSLLSKETIMQKTSGHADMHGCLETMQLIYVICNLDAETFMPDSFGQIKIFQHSFDRSFQASKVYFRQPFQDSG